MRSESLSVAPTDSSCRSSTETPASRRVPARWLWHYGVLVSLRDRLLCERGQLLHAAAEPLEPHSLNEADSATDEFDHNLALTQLSAEQDVLYEVDAALHRISIGTYGVCEESGRRIPAARLRAIPWTRYTCEVGERLENNGTVGRARLREATTVRDGGRPRFALDAEAEEAAEAPANDETMSPVTPPEGQPAGPHTTVQRSRNGK